MTDLEKRMLEVLIDLKENHHAIGIKAEFEAEGTRLEEALRLKEVVTKAGLDLTIKIGGCEALKDMYDARSIGVTRIIAPMIETPYALKKFLAATHFAYPKDEWNNMSFLINIETIDSVNNFDRMLESKQIHELKGIVIGRTDMCGSLGLTSDDINTEQVFEIVQKLLTKAKKQNMECVIGGGVGIDSIAFFNRLPGGLLDKCETRKVLFKCPEAYGKDGDKGILKAVGFELMWLKNKRNFYGTVYEEDNHRIEVLQGRYDKLIKRAGGQIE